MAVRKNLTMQEVAGAAGVSVATVSRVLTNSPGVGDATRGRVRALMDELGYHPNDAARKLVTRRTHNVLVVRLHVERRTPAQTAVEVLFQGLEDRLQEQGYRMTLVSRRLDDDGLAHLQLLREKAADGVILIGTRLGDRLALELSREKFPHVTVGRTIGMLDTFYVDIDNFDGAYQATKGLIDLGHRAICHVCGSQQTSIGVERLEGYRRALMDNGIAYDPSRVIEAGPTRDDTYEAVANYLENLSGAQPTAFFVVNDFAAVAVLRALRDKGFRIPSDVSVVGFDDDEVSRFLDPPLSSIKTPIYELGSRAAEILLQVISGDSLRTPQLVLPTTLVQRGSTAPPA